MKCLSLTGTHIFCAYEYDCVFIILNISSQDDERKRKETVKGGKESSPEVG